MIPTFLVSLAAFHLLERVLPPILPGYRTGPARKGWVADMISTMVNGSGLTVVTRVVAYLVLLRIPMLHDVLGDWSWGAQFALFFLVDDFARYALHVAYHRVPWLWRVHRVHHAETHMDALSQLRVHVGEAAIKSVLIALPFQVLGLRHDVLAVYLAIDVVKGFWHHANFATYAGPLNYLFVTAELHWWHHAAEGPGAGANFGNKLALWDWLFGTAYWPRGQWPERIGVVGMEAFPRDWIGQLKSARYSDEALIARLAEQRPAATPAEAVPQPAK
jgi:lathosterol oxidase